MVPRDLVWATGVGIIDSETQREEWTRGRPYITSGTLRWGR